MGTSQVPPVGGSDFLFGSRQEVLGSARLNEFLGR